MRSINPACKFAGLLVMTLVLAWWHDPVLNLAVFLMSVILILLSGTRVRSLFLMLSPILLFAVGMFFTGYRFSAGGDMPVAREKHADGEQQDGRQHQKQGSHPGSAEKDQNHTHKKHRQVQHRIMPPGQHQRHHKKSRKFAGGINGSHANLRDFL